VKQPFAACALGCVLGMSGVLCVLGLTIQEARADTAGREQVRTEHVWYGPDIALAYGAAYVLVGTGLALRQSESQVWEATGAVTAAAGGVVSLAIPPYVHWTHDNFGGGFLSLGGQVGGLVVGGLTGALVADSAGASDDGVGTGVLVGAALGHVTWALVDVFVLGRTDRLLERRITSRAW
jgi:hypothetical protein